MDEEIANKINLFFAEYPIREYSRGQILILNDEAPDKVFNLVKGNVKQYDVDYRGEEIVVNVYKPGTFFPMSFALNGGISRFIFEADTDIEIRQSPADKVVEFLKNNPDVTLNLLSRVYRGTDDLLGRIFQLASGSAQSRLPYEMSVTARRFGVKSDNGYDIDITEKDLASRSGLSRETVSREIKKMKDSKLVEMNPNGIKILDIIGLDTLHK